MNKKIILIAYFLSFFTYGFSSSKKLLSVKVNTLSQNESVKARYTVSKWNKNSKLITIGITNDGDKTEYIKDIFIQLNNSPLVNENSLILYGSYQMGRAPVVQHGVSENENYSETVLLIKNKDHNYFKTGIVTWNIFRPIISLSKNQEITIFADGENKPIKPGETINFEKIVIESGNNWQDMLYNYGKQIAEAQKITSKKINQFKGWSTWDYYGQIYTDKEIESNIKQLQELNVNANMIQIDGGWWKYRGDYLNSRSDIAGGMKGVAKLILKNGYSPGIHLDGFRAEKASPVYKEHPDWFLKDQNGNTIYSETQRPDRLEQSVYFDYSNPGACEYIKTVLKTIREDWGFNYFKIDFMCYGLNKEIFRAQRNTDLKEIHAYDTTMTSMERTRAGLKAMREGAGDSFFLGCSSVFGPTLGLVDGLRTGGDISPVMDFYSSRCLQNGGNFYLNSAVVETDADYLVVRNKEDEEANMPDRKHKYGGVVTQNEAKMWADYVSLFGGIKMSSDNLNTLRPERKKLINEAFSLNTCNRYIPIDFWDKARDKTDAFNIMMGTNDQGVFLALFNWNDEDLRINLTNLPTDNIAAVNNDERIPFSAKKKSLNVQLKPHTSVIFKLNNTTDFDKVRNQIAYSFNR
jgi:alpha-galactosidase